MIIRFGVTNIDLMY